MLQGSLVNLTFFFLFVQTKITINFKYILGSHSIVVRGRARNTSGQNKQFTVRNDVTEHADSVIQNREYPDGHNTLR